MSRDTMTWEQRVEALELDGDKQAELVSSIHAELAERDERIAGLQTVVDGLHAAEEARAQAAQQAYLSEIKARCGDECQQPLSPEDLEPIEEAFARGDDAGARFMGDLLVERAELRARGKTSSSSRATTRTVTLGQAEADQKAEASYVHKTLKDAGKDVRLSEDGLHVFEGDRRLM